MIMEGKGNKSQNEAVQMYYKKAVRNVPSFLLQVVNPEVRHFGLGHSTVSYYNCLMLIKIEMKLNRSKI